MAKKKLKLNELKVQSFVTTLSGDDMNQIKGGSAVVRGRFFTYRTKWTMVETRSDTGDTTLAVSPVNTTNGNGGH